MAALALRPPAIPWLLAVCFALEFAWMSVAYGRTPNHVLPAAVALDAVLLVALAVWWRGRAVAHRERWQTALPQVIRAFALALVATVAVMNLSGLPGARAAWAWLLVLEPLLLLLVVATVARIAVRARGLPGWDDVRDELAHIVPRRVADLVLAELRIVLAAFAALRRTPVPAPGEGAVTHSAKDPLAGLVLAVTVVSLVELPAVHALLHFVVAAPSWAHAAVFAVHAWGAVWLIGDLRLMRASWHALEPDGLRIALGLRWRAFIPYEALWKVELLPPKTGPLADTVDVTPLPPPNVCVQLRGPVVLEGLFGLRRTTRDLHLYVDAPEALVRALTAAAGTPRPSVPAASS